MELVDLREGPTKGRNMAVANGKIFGRLNLMMTHLPDVLIKHFEIQQAKVGKVQIHAFDDLFVIRDGKPFIVEKGRTGAVLYAGDKISIERAPTKNIWFLLNRIGKKVIFGDENDVNANNQNSADTFFDSLKKTTAAAATAATAKTTPPATAAAAATATTSAPTSSKKRKLNADSIDEVPPPSKSRKSGAQSNKLLLAPSSSEASKNQSSDSGPSDSELSDSSDSDDQLCRDRCPNPLRCTKLTNRKHLKKFCHPYDKDWKPFHPDGHNAKKRCRHMRNCGRQRRSHFKRYYHKEKDDQSNVLEANIGN